MRARIPLWANRVPPAANSQVSLRGRRPQGTYTALPGGLERPQDHREVSDPTGVTHFLPPPPFRPQPSWATSGPSGPSAAGAPPIPHRGVHQPQTLLGLCSQHLPGPFKFAQGDGRKRSGITGPPARTSCALEGARMEEHR